MERLHRGSVTAPIGQRRLQHHHVHGVAVGISTSHLKSVTHHPHIVSAVSFGVIEIFILILIVVLLSSVSVSAHPTVDGVGFL